MTNLATAVIPARGGSTGVRRKNLRTVDGVPLVARTLTAALAAHTVGTIIVTSDDPEVLAVAAHWSGGDPDVVLHRRPDALAEAHVTVADVVADALPAGSLNATGPVVVLQPTSPFTDDLLIDAVVDSLAAHESVATAAADQHARWTADGPLHATATNRQYAAATSWHETGAVVAVRSFPAAGGPVDSPFVSADHLLFDPADEMEAPPVVAERYALDVDSPADFAAARDLATRGRIGFLVTAGPRTGSGHVHRALTLADELTAHDVRFLFTGEAAEWAADLVKHRGYPVCTSWPSNPDGTINADLVVADCLDHARHATSLAGRGHRPALAVFECLDLDVAASADLLVNALYDGPGLTGGQWEPLRPEFCTPAHLDRRRPSVNDTRVIVTMGGADPAHLTERVARELLMGQVSVAMFGDTDARLLAPSGLDVRLLWPPGRADNVPDDLANDVWGGSVSAAFAWADVAVTAGGRTVLEAAAMSVPVVAVCANDRETTHTATPGVMWLGHHALVPPGGYRQAVTWLLDNPDERYERAAAARRSVNPAGAAVALAEMLDGLVRR